MVDWAVTAVGARLDMARAVTAVGAVVERAVTAGAVDGAGTTEASGSGAVTAVGTMVDGAVTAVGSIVDGAVTADGCTDPWAVEKVVCPVAEPEAGTLRRVWIAWAVLLPEEPVLTPDPSLSNIWRAVWKLDVSCVGAVGAVCMLSAVDGVTMAREPVCCTGRPPELVECVELVDPVIVGSCCGAGCSLRGLGARGVEPRFGWT